MVCAGPCYRCLFPEAPEPQSCSSCSDAGVLGVVPGIIGSLQVLLAECMPYSQVYLHPGYAVYLQGVFLDGTLLAG